MPQENALNNDSLHELLEALAAGQRIIVSEQRRIQAQLGRIETAVQGLNVRVGAVETRAVLPQAPTFGALTVGVWYNTGDKPQIANLQNVL